MRCDKDTAIRSNVATCFSFATTIVVKLRKNLRSSHRIPTQPYLDGGMAAESEGIPHCTAYYSAWRRKNAGISRYSSSGSTRPCPPVILTSRPLAPARLKVFQQRTGNRRFGRLTRPPVADRPTGAHHRHAHFGHHGAHVGEVDVDHARAGDQVGDALHRAQQHVVGRA
jgi:hypothetical protein